MNITIILDSSRLELLGSSGAGIIEKLYLIAVDFNNTLTLEGNIISTNAYGYLVDYLNTNYGPNFIVNTTNRYIHFEDPNMESYLASMGIGTDGKVTEAQAAAVTVIANASNSTITKFNELKYFTNITGSRGGISGSDAGKCKFYLWTALEEVDISNFTSIGHNNSYGWEDTFNGCSSLRKVIASDKLILIGFNGFRNCSNLETFIGLSGTIEVWDNAFYNCSKLPQSFFQPLSFLIKSCTDNYGLNFLGCTLLTSIDIADGTTLIPTRCFTGCSNLTTVTIPNSVTHIKGYAFNSCSSLTTLTIPTTVTSIDGYSFLGCTNLTTITGLSNVTTTGPRAFDGCSNLTSVDLTTTSTFAANLFENCSNLTTIGSWVNNTVTITPTNNGNQFRTFYNCQKLEFPEELTVEFLSDSSRGQDMGAYCFYHCNKLKKVILSGTNINLGQYVFYDSGLTQIQGTENIKYIGGNVFNGTNISGTLNLCNCVGPGTRNSGFQTPDLHCLLGNVSGITKVILGDWDTTFNKTNWIFQGEYRSFFDNCSGLTTVDFKSMYDFPNIRYLDLNYIRSGFFHKCPNMTNLIIRQESVVPLKYTDDIVHSNDIGGPNATLYVPDSVVNDYKTAAGWSNIASQIKGLSELPS